jgi:hypothetical protein
LADPALAQALAEPTQDLQRAIDAHQLPSANFWRQLVPLSASVESNHSLAETTLIKLLGRTPRIELIVHQFTRAIGHVKNAFREALPRLNEELPLRAGPLREQWEARGPGLLRRLAELTEASVVPQRVEVVIVHPALGGGGRAHLSYNGVTFEGVLANPHFDLPETARLAWLVAQLQSDLPKYSEPIHADRLEPIAAFALLIPALLAANEMELVHYSPALVGRAIQAWDLVVPPEIDAPALLLDWWQTYFDTRPDWGVALTALDQMFG